MKISITIDLTKIDKTKIVNREFTNKAGEKITAKDLKLDIVPLKEPKILKEGDTWQLVKTHFVSMSQTKQERESNTKSTIIGDGVQLQDKGTTVSDNLDF